MKTATLVGQRFGRLLVIALSREAITTRETTWLCRCDCGSEKITRTRNLTRGKCASCGCLRREINARLFTKHGATIGEWPSEFRPWLNMKTRCRYEHRRDFKYYGDRGVTIYEPWKTDFEAFRAHIGPRPTLQHSIDRIDPNGNYEPGNVRWATPIEQNNNRRNTRFVIFRGERVALAEAIRAAGNVINSSVAAHRIQRGWPIEQAIETPPDKRMQALAKKKWAQV